MKKNNFNRLFLTLPIVVFIYCCCYGQKEGGISRIEGTVKGLGNNEVVLVNDRNVPVDTVKAVNGRFVLKHPIGTSDKSKIYLIYLPCINEFYGKNFENHIIDLVPIEKEAARRRMISRMIGGEYGIGTTDKVWFFIESKKINITGEIMDDGLRDVTVMGSPLTDEYNTLEAGFPVTAEIKKYSGLYYKLKKEIAGKLVANKIIDSLAEKIEKGMRYRKILDSLYTVKRQEIIDAIPAHNKNSALACIAYQTFTASGKSSLTMLKNALSKFSPELKDSRYIRLLRDKLKEWEVGTAGTLAPDFVLKDSSGRATKLSSLRGNYVLLDFWASWCGPCREGIPNMIEAWDRFSGKGLKILAVSVDKNKDKWLRALEEEKMPYPQLMDGLGITRKLYRYTGIPHLVLIGPDGRIKRINKGLKGKGLIKTLEILYPN